MQWLDVLPGRLNAVLIANEVLDAIPTQIVRTRAGGIEELGVTIGPPAVRASCGASRPATGALLREAAALALPDDYETEINLAARAFVKASRVIARGVPCFSSITVSRRRSTTIRSARAARSCATTAITRTTIPFRAARIAGHHRARGLHGHRFSGSRRGVERARVRDAGAVPGERRDYRDTRGNSPDRRARLRAARGASAEAAVAGGNGRAVQSARARGGNRPAADRFHARQSTAPDA